MTSGKSGDFFRITTRNINVGGVLKRVTGIESGATVLFIGTVRKSSRGREVEYLEYECYMDMALREFEKIAGEIREKWSVKKVAIVHRTGKLELGEISVVIAVSAPHRDEAYSASRYAIEKLKQNVPIWKKEVWDGGEEWIQGA